MNRSQAYYPKDKALSGTRTAGQGAYSRPYENKTYSSQDISLGHISRAAGYSNKPNPIKHWRKQLIPRRGSGSSSRSVGIPFNAPGSTATVPQAPSPGHPVPVCDVVRGAQKLPLPPSHQSPNVFYQDPHKPDLYFYWANAKSTGKRVYFSGDGYPGTSVCIGCNPEANLIRPTAGTSTKRINPIAAPNTSPNEPGKYTTVPYSFDTRAYLRARSKSYDTKLGGRKSKNIEYSRLTDNCCVAPLPPNPDPTISSGTRISLFPTHLTANNHEGQRSQCCSVTMKPNNPQFFQEGAVSSSSRIERLKLNTLRSTKKTSPLTTAWGLQAENSGVYRRNGQGPYFMKNKKTICRAAPDYTLMDGSLMFPGRRRYCSRSRGKL